MVNISVTPKVSLVDEKIKIVVTGLEPNSDGEFLVKMNNIFRYIGSIASNASVVEGVCIDK